MDDHKTVSVAKIYVPNEYTVYLSPADRGAFESYEATLTGELAAYLEAHARGNGLSVVAPPTVKLETDSDLRTGEFGIACRMVDAPAPAAAPAISPAPAPAPPPPAPAPVNPAMAGVSGTQVMSAEEARKAGLRPETMTLVVNGARHRLTSRITSLGRSKDRDIVVPDPNVSRAHCEIRHVGYDYFLIDLDSTNGVEVNGEAVKRHALADGDRIVLGTTEIEVEVS